MDWWFPEEKGVERWVKGLHFMLMYGTYIYGDDHFVVDINTELQCCTPETYVMLYINRSI